MYKPITQSKCHFVTNSYFSMRFAHPQYLAIALNAYPAFGHAFGTKGAGFKKPGAGTA